MEKPNIDNNEPSLEKIEDYNNNESKEKRRTVIAVVIFCLLVGAVFTYFKTSHSEVEEYVGTPEKPGINTTKGY